MEDRSFNIYNGKEWKTIYPIDECIENLKNLYEYQKTQIEELAEKNAELSADGWKDKELQDMCRQVKEAKNELHNGFGIKPDVKKAIEDWQCEHIKVRHSPTQSRSAIGGQFTYTFSPTSIGTFGSCICSLCQRKIDKEVLKYAILKQNIEGLDSLRNSLMKENNAEFVFEEP